ncbi:MAG: hypothetical protein VZQ83_00705 [Eubacterium sp.]|nr:hypothetical protein [Eubacterium sp.]
MDIQKEYDDIVDEFYRCFSLKNIKKEECEFITELLKKQCDGKRIGVYGTGLHTEKLGELYSLDDIMFYIDSSRNSGEYNGKRVISPYNEHIKWLDVIIISSFVHRKEMEEKLYEVGFCGKVIDIYDEINAEFSDVYNSTFVSFFDEYVPANDELYRLLINYKRFGGENDIQLFIIGLLKIYDFKNALSYLDEYCEIYGRQNEGKGASILKAVDRLTNLLNRIKSEIQSRPYKDIIINWVDNIGVDFKEMRFLSSIVEKSVVYKDAYTVIPYTSSVIETINYGENNIDARLFEKRKDKSDSRLVEACKKHHYEFKHLAMKSYTSGYPEGCEEYQRKVFRNTRIPSTVHQWEALRLLTSVNEPLVIIIHNLWETHQPFCSPFTPRYTWNYYEYTEYWNEHPEMHSKLEVNRINCRYYLDEQLEWYYSFLNGNSIKIYFSDHGFRYNNYYEESRSRILFSVMSDSLQPRCIDKGVFSLNRFIDVLDLLMSGGTELERLTDDFAPLQNYDTYMILYVLWALDGKQNKRLSLQYRGGTDGKYKYIRFVDGKEYFFVLPDEDTNYIDDKSYADDIERLKRNSGDDFIDVFEEDFFIRSRILYDYWGLSCH